jgi:hypothetical protein
MKHEILNGIDDNASMVDVVMFGEDPGNSWQESWTFVSVNEITEETRQRICDHFERKGDDMWQAVDQIDDSWMDMADFEKRIDQAMHEDACFVDDRLKVVNLDTNRMVEFFQGEVIDHGTFWGV